MGIEEHKASATVHVTQPSTVTLAAHAHRGLIIAHKKIDICTYKLAALKTDHRVPFSSHGLVLGPDHHLTILQT